MIRTIFLTLVLLCMCVPASMATAKMDFDTWLRGVRYDAKREGVSDRTIQVALNADLKPVQKIIDLDRKQPEGTITFAKYRGNTVNATRIKKGKNMLWRHRHELSRVQAAYNVPSRFVVALWGIETNYGGYTGGFDVVTALATLAWDGRRADFFKKELMNALHILDQGHIPHAQMKGSWAGAMGQSQFMPSSFLKFAVDFNRDGRRDIWNTHEDVFASASNYLVMHGWKSGETWGREVRLPKGFNPSLAGLDTKKHISEWARLGVRTAWGGPLPTADIAGSIIQPDGAGGPAYLVYDNFRVFMKWNKSIYFATAVGLLADSLIAD